MAEWLVLPRVFNETCCERRGCRGERIRGGGASVSVGMIPLEDATC